MDEKVSATELTQNLPLGFLVNAVEMKFRHQA
jgi:hypothetical protein